jgi:pimeloyl-ACP methyl ester carboxylesterase
VGVERRRVGLTAGITDICEKRLAMRPNRADAMALAFFGFVASANATEKLGIVMLHGKQGVPEQLEAYDGPLGALDYLSERPEMCWSRRRIYDQPYPECLREIDTSIEHLKSRGATAFAIIGMSLGGNAVLAYGARHQGLRGIVTLAPAHPAEILAQRSDIGKSIEQAHRMIADGRGDTKTTFAEINTGKTFTVTTTPKIYLSFHGANSIAVMPGNAAKLTAPLLYVAGTQDVSQRGPDYIFNKVPKNELSRYVLVPADHRGTPTAGLHAVVEWLKELAER